MITVSVRCKTVKQVAHVIEKLNGGAVKTPTPEVDPGIANGNSVYVPSMADTLSRIRGQIMKGTVTKVERVTMETVHSARRRKKGFTRVVRKDGRVFWRKHRSCWSFAERDSKKMGGLPNNHFGSRVFSLGQPKKIPINQDPSKARCELACGAALDHKNRKCLSCSSNVCRSCWDKIAQSCRVCARMN